MRPQRFPHSTGFHPADGSSLRLVDLARIRAFKDRTISPGLDAQLLVESLNQGAVNDGADVEAPMTVQPETRHTSYFRTLNKRRAAPRSKQLSLPEPLVQLLGSMQSTTSGCTV